MKNRIPDCISSEQFVNHLFIIAIQIQKSFAIISDTTDKEDAAAAELRNLNRFIIINIPIHLINERKRTMKKTIRKIGASLLAIGVTAAGMSSIPASAYVPSITRYTNFYVGRSGSNNYLIHCSGVLSYTPGESYYVSTTARHSKVNYVYVWGTREYEGGGAAYDNTPKRGKYQVGYTYTGDRIIHFRSHHKVEADARFVNPYIAQSSIYV